MGTWSWNAPEGVTFTKVGETDDYRDFGGYSYGIRTEIFVGQTKNNVFIRFHYIGRSYGASQTEQTIYPYIRTGEDAAYSKGPGSTVSLKGYSRPSDNVYYEETIHKTTTFYAYGSWWSTPTPVSYTFKALNVARVRYNGSWKEATPYVKDNGVWKEAQPFARVNGVWKEAT